MFSADFAELGYVKKKKKKESKLYVTLGTGKSQISKHLH